MSQHLRDHQGQSLRLIRDAYATIESDGNNSAKLILNGGEVEHIFDAKSRVSKSLLHTTEDQLSNRLTGGQYLVRDTDEGAELIDFRYGNYNGFIHTDDMIQRLNETIGATDEPNRKRNMGRRHSVVHPSVRLINEWSNSNLSIDLYKEGGEFQTRTMFQWSPFQSHVSTAFEILRLICTNGMMGFSSIMNSKIPLMNMERENLDIAAIQLQNKLDNMVGQRLERMGTEHATVAELMVVANHALDRLKDTKAYDVDAEARLRNIRAVADPRRHLGDVYKDSIYDNSNLCAQLPGHLTTMDLWNIATEMSSHTPEAKSSSDHALDKLTNSIIFGRANNANEAVAFDRDQVSPFSDPTRAFFGDISTAGDDGSQRAFA